MSTNIFGRDTTEDQKYQDLYASVKRIVEKSAKEEAELKSTEDTSEAASTISQKYSEYLSTNGTKKEA